MDGGANIVKSAFDRAVASHTKNDIAAAETAYLSVGADDPNYAAALTNLGLIYAERKEFDLAIDFHQRSIAVLPDNYIARSNIGFALNAAHRHAEAIEHLKASLWLKPDEAITHCNLGIACIGTGRDAQGFGFLKTALALDPKLADAHKTLGTVLLRHGNYAAGWKEYGWRFAADKVRMRPYKHPMWDGNPVDGELLIWSEQGVGDEILYAGMLNDLVAAGHNVVCEIDVRLMLLFERSFPKVRFIPRSDPPYETINTIQAQLPSGSLGFYLRREAKDFPERQSYLKPDADRAAGYRAKLGVKSGEKLIGISWASRSVAMGERKGTRLADWSNILGTQGCRFVDLQYGDTQNERAACSVKPVQIEGLDRNHDFDGLAALISACDLVITVSNVTAHLAGALGIPVWILVPPNAGRPWYLGADTDTRTPWYPSAELFRNPAENTLPIGQIEKRIAALVS